MRVAVRLVLGIRPAGHSLDHGVRDLGLAAVTEPASLGMAPNVLLLQGAAHVGVVERVGQVAQRVLPNQALDARKKGGTGRQPHGLMQHAQISGWRQPDGHFHVEQFDLLSFEGQQLRDVVTQVLGDRQPCVRGVHGGNVEDALRALGVGGGGQVGETNSQRRDGMI